MITLSAMNYERYQSIIHPLAHRAKLTKKKLSSYVFLASAAFTITCILILFNYEQLRLLAATVSIILFLISTAYVYIRIFLAAKNTHSVQNPPNAIASEESTTKKNLKEIKLAKSCFMIFLLFVFSFLPVAITPTLKAQEFGPIMLANMRPWSVTILMLNSSLNLVISFWTRPILRKEALKIFGKTHR